MNIRFNNGFTILLIAIFFLFSLGLTFYHFGIYLNMDEKLLDLHTSTSFLSTYKVLYGFGFSTLVSGLFFNFIMGGYYEKLKNDIIFRHSLIVFLIRFTLFVLSACFFYFSDTLFPYPENYIEPEESLISLDNFLSLVILLIIFVSIFRQYKDRNDYLKFSKDKIEFFDNDVGKFECIPENIKIIANIEKCYESDGKVKSTDVISFIFFDKTKGETIFNLESTSLDSRGELIKKELNKLFKVEDKFTN